MFAGRTGRFGRKGISINFVHDKATWQQMEQIERITGKQIIRIETNDLDAMEEVRSSSCPFRSSFPSRAGAHLDPEQSVFCVLCTCVCADGADVWTCSK